METVGLLEHSEALATVIADSDVFCHYLERRKALVTSQSAQQLIARFQALKPNYEEARRFGRRYPNYQTIIAQTMAAKRAVDLHPLVAAYKRADRKLQQLLQAVSGKLAGAVSDSIKVPGPEVFFDQGCGTSCRCSPHVNV